MGSEFGPGSSNNISCSNWTTPITSGGQRRFEPRYTPVGGSGTISCSSKIILSPTLNAAIMDEDRERSLSPMSLGSPSSTPPQSPIIERIPNVFRVQSPVTEPPKSSQDSGDTSSLPAEPSTPTSETADMDLQSSPSSASSSSSDIPGLVTGLSWRAPAPPHRPVEPGLEQPGSPPKAVIPSLPSVQPSISERIHPSLKESPPSAVPPTVNKPATLPPKLTISVPKKLAIVNPFVSGGFMTEFVGSPASLTAQKSLPPKSRTGSPNMSEAQSTPTPISTPAPPRSNPPPQAPTFVPASSTVSTSLSPCAPSSQFSTKPSPPPPAVPARLSAQEQRLLAAPLPPTPPSVPQPPRTQAYPSSLPPRPSDTVIAYSNKAPYKPGYSPITSASDARISYNATGTISNPLNIRPSRFAPLKATPIQSQQAPKKPLTIGNGWPHTRQANGHGSTSISPVTSKALPPPTGTHRPLTPESTRSSTTPPGLSNFVAYTSPSPPGFLHKSLRDKPPTDSPSSSGEPNVKHEYLDVPLPPTPTTTVKQKISIQSPRPVLPASITSPSIFRFSTESNSATPPSDSKGKKRAMSTASDAESTRPRKRTHPWPTQESMYSTRIKSDSDAGVREIVFSSDGERMAVVCHDRTIRIWSVSNRVETARLAQNSPISSVAWMADDNGIITLGQDGMISKWTRNNHWQWAKLLDAGKEESISFTYNRDRLAVAFPRFGVRVWLWIKGTWQPQRSILRQNVTCIKFVEDGEALLGGTSDGVLWYCQVPNGTLRAYAFLKAKIRHLDVSPNGTQALVSQVGARAHLVGIQGMDRKGKIEQVYAMNGDSTSDAKQSTPAVFVNGGRSVVFHSRESSCLVWNKMKGEVLSGLDHGDDEQTQAVAGFDRASHSYIVTGTAQGLLSWWNSPPDQ
ncbi:WD40-repeat-containing domain protein [Suillus variegatus]|nr:WD40-repeat-containing domain protein [Suillus variegatus]